MEFKPKVKNPYTNMTREWVRKLPPPFNPSKAYTKALEDFTIKYILIVLGINLLIIR